MVRAAVLDQTGGFVKVNRCVGEKDGALVVEPEVHELLFPPQGDEVCFVRGTAGGFLNHGHAARSVSRISVSTAIVLS